MVEALQNIGTKIVAVILATSAFAGSALATAQTKFNPSSETAVVASNVAPPSASATTPLVAALPPLIPNLLPSVGALATSTTSTDAVAPKIAKKPASAITAGTQKTVPTATTTPAVPASAITAQWLLDNTTLTFRQNLDGTLKGIFTANIGSQPLTWGVDDRFIGGTNGIPQFSFSFSCAPVLTVPPSNASNQTPFFTVRTSYDCTIGFAATAGSDQTERSKEMQFETNPGELTVTIPPAMNAVLADGTNNGGLVFTNSDTNPITITGLSLDISYQGLSTIQGPTTLSFLDPSTNNSLFDYNMENVPADPSAQFSYATTGVSIPLSFVVPAQSQKLLPFQVRGVHSLSISNLNPTITINVEKISTDVTDVPIVINGAQVQWSCVVPLVPYDPNATSGPFADGTACK